MKTAALLAFGAAALFFTGCQNVNTVQRAQPQATPTLVEDQRIITDQTLAKALQLISVNEGKVSGDLLKIQATLQNTKSRDRTFKYRFEWIGADGMEISAPGNGWRVITFQGGEVRAISAVASSPKIVDFRLKLQES